MKNTSICAQVLDIEGMPYKLATAAFGFLVIDQNLHNVLGGSQLLCIGRYTVVLLSNYLCESDSLDFLHLRNISCPVQNLLFVNMYRFGV